MANTSPVVLEAVVAPLASIHLVLVIAGFRDALVAALLWSHVLERTAIPPAKA